MYGDPNENINDLSNTITNNIGTLPDFTVLSSSLVVTGGTTSLGAANLGLILGITVPLLVLRTSLVI